MVQNNVFTETQSSIANDVLQKAALALRNHVPENKMAEVVITRSP